MKDEGEVWRSKWAEPNHSPSSAMPSLLARFCCCFSFLYAEAPLRRASQVQQVQAHQVHICLRTYLQSRLKIRCSFLFPSPFPFLFPFLFPFQFK